MLKVLLSRVILLTFITYGSGYAVSAQADSATVDVVGIRTGMKPDEVRTILKKRYPSTKIEENLYRERTAPGGAPPLSVMVVELGPKGKNGFEEEILIRFTATTGKVYWILRNLNKDAPKTAYEQAIFEKYGDAPYKPPFTGMQHWNWNVWGQPMLDTSGFCLAALDRDTPPALDRTCGIGLTARILNSAKPDTAERLRIAVMDSAVLAEEMDAVKKARLTDPSGASQKPKL